MQRLFFKRVMKPIFLRVIDGFRKRRSTHPTHCLALSSGRGLGEGKYYGALYL